MPDSLTETHRVSIGQTQTEGLAPLAGPKFWTAACQRCEWETSRWTWSEVLFVANRHVVTTKESR